MSGHLQLHNCVKDGVKRKLYRVALAFVTVKSQLRQRCQIERVQC